MQILIPYTEKIRKVKDYWYLAYTLRGETYWYAKTKKNIFQRTKIFFFVCGVRLLKTKIFNCARLPILAIDIYVKKYLWT